MIIKKIEITRQKITLQGEMKLVDSELSKQNMEEVISRLVSWKLGPLKPIRHFEMVYNDEKKHVEADVYVAFSINESSESHIDTVKHIFNKLIEFITLYEKEFDIIREKM